MLSSDLFYHGSRKCGLTELIVQYSNFDAPFGPAIYLTKDKNVADCYAQNGSIYLVKICGNLDYSINLDASFSEQTVQAREAINVVKKHFYSSLRFETIHVRKIVHFDHAMRAEVNSYLKHLGVWMLYGQLDGIEQSGLMDRGIQYAVIDESKIIIT
jgi:hypothetical protein